MSSLTAIIITKNEENMIADCIESLSFCDQVLVIDSHSTDRTADIAKKMGAKVFAYDTRSFAEKRNRALQHVKTDWLLYIDADERVTPELQQEIQRTIKDKKNTIHGFKVRRKNFYLGDHQWPEIEELERLFRKSAIHGWHGDLHETADFKGPVGTLENFVLHYTHRDLHQMLEKTIAWSDIEAQLRFSAHHPPMQWWRFFRVMVTAFYNFYIRQQGWKVGMAGLIESIYQSFSIFVTYAKLWELQSEKERKSSI